MRLKRSTLNRIDPMNPIALIGVASSGLSLIQNLRAGPQAPTKGKFEGLLPPPEGPLPLKEYVQNQGLHTIEDLHAHIEGLKTSLKGALGLNNPLEEPTSILAFDVNGAPYIESSNAEHLPLPQELKALAQQIGQLSYLESQMAHFPESSLWSLAQTIPMERWNSTLL
jgi:hypothetical protein